MAKLILASKSPRRKKLLEQIGLPFEIFPSNASEDIDLKDPTEFAKTLAIRKAEEVAAHCPDSIIIGADTVVVLDNHILNKPQNHKEAFEMLTMLSGNMHEVITGVCLLQTNKKCEIVNRREFAEITEVFFRNIMDHEIIKYIKGGSPMDKAGGYGIQDDWGALFVERINGDYNNVVGFPLSRFYMELHRLNPDVIDQIITD
ncbi:Maf family protein [Balneola sp. MJW-20]|uniref:Maf family protein n=1 Tax=Gracilimonas aurantiaca TaxID=3234185 RepID=UPI003465207B